jgi:dUTP pyrophosphatase
MRVGFNGPREPFYATPGAAGMDILSDESTHILPGHYGLISTGIKVLIPCGYEIQIRPRSGLALKYGVTVLNSPGTIDSDYRGEIKIILINHGLETFYITSGDRIAQMVLAKVEQIEWNPNVDFDSTQRSSCGFGSTGIQ